MAEAETTRGPGLFMASESTESRAMRGTAIRTSALGRAAEFPASHVLYGPSDMSTTTHPIEIAAARAQWHPQGAYLNTASYALPPDCAWDAMQAALEDWRGGRTSWEHWGDSTEGARAAFAAIAGVEPETVATAATVSELIGLVAASLPDGTRVLAPDIDFTS